jgi:hypothetical protein
MGNNVNLHEMLGAPKTLECPGCKSLICTHFDDYDIEYGNPFPCTDRVELNCYCDNCKKEWVWSAKIVLSQTEVGQQHKAEACELVELRALVKQVESELRVLRKKYHDGD